MILYHYLATLAQGESTPNTSLSVTNGLTRSAQRRGARRGVVGHCSNDGRCHGRGCRDDEGSRAGQDDRKDRARLVGRDGRDRA